MSVLTGLMVGNEFARAVRPIGRTRDLIDSFDPLARKHFRMAMKKKKGVVPAVLNNVTLPGLDLAERLGYGYKKPRRGRKPGPKKGKKGGKKGGAKRSHKKAVRSPKYILVG